MSEFSFHENHSNIYRTACPCDEKLKGYPRIPKIKVNNPKILQEQPYEIFICNASNNRVTKKQITLQNCGQGRCFISVKAFLDQKLKNQSDLVSGPIQMEQNQLILKSHAYN